MLGWVCLLAFASAATPPNPFAASRHRKEAPDLPGDSHVPGFPTTPARLTQEYLTAFLRAEEDAPDAERMLHACKHPDMSVEVITYLPRYFSPLLIEPARKLARSGDPAVQAGAISGLISLLDTARETRIFVRALLRAPGPVLRGRAAEYLCWLGSAEDYPFLANASAAERDVYARAAMLEAAAAIKQRATVFGDGAAATFPPGGGPAEIYRQVGDALAARPTAATRQAAIARLRGAEAVEPITRFADRLDNAERGAALLRAQRLLAGYAQTCDAPAQPGDAAPVALPVARTLMAPVRGYFEARRKSYGVLISPETGGPYVGKYHVGDDCAWQKDFETVVAIGDGIVRSVDLGRESWGGLVIVEHEDAAGGRFCSLYGHLGPLVCVHPGQTVRQGAKLGVIGPSWSYANGGFLSHLHFGIHRSAFLAPDRVGALVLLTARTGETATATVSAVHENNVELRIANGRARPFHRSAYWMAGYLTATEFTSKIHDWVDPQEFIRNFK